MKGLIKRDTVVRDGEGGRYVVCVSTDESACAGAVYPLPQVTEVALAPDP